MNRLVKRKASRLQFSAVLISGLLALVPYSAAKAGPIVVPGFDAATEGNSNNAYPFNLAVVHPGGGPALTAMRYQQLYASAAFGTSPLKISGIAFRPDANTGEAFSSVLLNVVIKLSTTSAQIGGLSLIYASNESTDLLTVFSGPLALSSAFTGPAIGPKDFDIAIDFQMPFLFNPMSGNLLLEVQNFGGGETTQFDADTSPLLMSRLYNLTDSATAPIGQQVNLPGFPTGLVTEFKTTASIPEPVSISMFGVGIGGLFAARRKNKTCRTS